MSVLELIITLAGIGFGAIIVIAFLREYWHVIVSIAGGIILIIAILFLCGLLESIKLPI